MKKIIVNLNKNFNSRRASTIQHNKALEIIWTLIPTIILVLIAIPSILLLYEMNTPDGKPELTVKIIGHQWYWNYSYSVIDDSYTWYSDPAKPYSIVESYNNLIKIHEIETLNRLNFDSYMVQDADLTDKHLRLLDTDYPLILPSNTTIRLLVTSNDVIHSWTVPAFGLKIDAIPGRLNQVWLKIDLEGIYYGQCSELCGVNHPFMPIKVKVVAPQDFPYESMMLLYRTNKDAYDIVYGDTINGGYAIPTEHYPSFNKALAKKI